MKEAGMMINIRVDELLREQGRTFYWLAKETGISHTTLWRLKKGKALGINFETLEKLCLALACNPGDVLTLSATTKRSGKPTTSTKTSSRSTRAAPLANAVTRK
jgi:putative transcriptional regulator